jgi:hypothetical protein
VLVGLDLEGAGVVVVEGEEVRDARLHAVSSRNMYSEHGFEARMRPPAGQVCQSFMVVLKCRPGSPRPRPHGRCAPQRSRAGTVFFTLPFRNTRFQFEPASTARRKSSVIETELLEFWPETVR